MTLSTSYLFVFCGGCETLLCTMVHLISTTGQMFCYDGSGNNVVHDKIMMLVNGTFICNCRKLGHVQTVMLYAFCPLLCPQPFV